ncbi:response regulator [Paenibacillus cremeus]|uniref:Response regulator n=1 Tax=Paenibacillus cremeus TaxID=2163881 RepID=A0A559KG92_9BACL|nr:response regulator [Paenibacillus cremeus]TVY11154.1 response regulator [Paenibacillus cremeus]
MKDANFNNPEMQMVLKNQLEQFGFIVNVAATEAEVFESSYPNQRYDLVLVDWSLQVGGSVPARGQNQA